MIRSLLAALPLSFVVAVAFLAVHRADAQVEPEQSSNWVDAFGSIAIQQDGRTMPLDTYARQLAVDLTGRTKWREGKGPDVFAGRHPVELLADLIYRPEHVAHEPLIAVNSIPIRNRLGLDPERKFFSAIELANSTELRNELDRLRTLHQENENYRATSDERKVLAVQTALGIVNEFMGGKALRIVPSPDSASFRDVATGQAFSNAPADVQNAFSEVGRIYKTNGTSESALLSSVENLRGKLASAGTIPMETQRRVNLEVFYNHHKPWMKTAFLYGLAIVFFGLSALFWRRALTVIGGLFLAGGVAEQLLGLYLRTEILARPPVSNTYEAILWMGLVAIAVAIVAQALNKKGWYLLGGVIAAELCVLFAMLVPLRDQTNTLPPVLRSNYWLIVHVLVIVASYGVLGLSAVLAHAYLLRSVLFRRKKDGPPRPLGNALITQVYRTMQIGVFLLTVGTILGGVWAADSWGRFWGWDPKETWALISIVVYFAFIHGRFVGWIRDFGMAVASIIGFLCIVWTFYGVNYVMASGLHSYGFGAGGEFWVGLAVLAEIALIIVCNVRYRMLVSHSNTTGDASALRVTSAATNATDASSAMTSGDSKAPAPSAG